jgi:hypothetical protein
MTQYRAVVGIDYPPNKRVEAGDLVSDLPEKDIKWLLSSEFIEEVNGKGETTTPVVKEIIEEPVVEEVVPEVVVEVATEVVEVTETPVVEETE